MHLKFVLEYVKYAKTTIDLVLPPDLVVSMCGFFSDMTRLQVASNRFWSSGNLVVLTRRVYAKPKVKN